MGVSPSLLRSWEALGLVRPLRSRSRYRLFTARDLRILKRARFLRRTRMLNPAAIVHVLKNRGLLRPRRTVPNPLGQRLRGVRLKRNLSLAEVAGRAGISIGFLSAIERGHMSASVGTLRKLADFYDLNILDFFDPPGANPHLVTPPQRKVLEAGPGVRMELLAWGGTVMEPHLFCISPGAGSGGSYTHEGEEFLHVLRGRLAIQLENREDFLLRPGDSFYFESAIPHRWANPGKSETLVLWVNTPPTF